MVNDKNYGRMATEVLELLKHFPKEQVDKIPKSLIEQFSQGKDINIDAIIDDSKKMFEQDVCDETLIMMYLIFKNFWASPEEREKIDARLKEIKQDFNEKYSSENLFFKKFDDRNTI